MRRVSETGNAIQDTTIPAPASAWEQAAADDLTRRKITWNPLRNTPLPRIYAPRGDE